MANDRERVKITNKPDESGFAQVVGMALDDLQASVNEADIKTRQKGDSSKPRDAAANPPKEPVTSDSTK